MLLLGVVLLVLAATDAITFPRICITGNRFRVPCCPLYNGSPCGSSSNRGTCVSLTSYWTGGDPDVTFDEKYEYPSFFFSSVCRCRGNYGGVNCGGCRDNYYGDNCDRQYTIVRREIRQLNTTEREEYFIKLHYCKTKMDPDYVIMRVGDRMRSSTFEFLNASYYDVWSFNHYYATTPFINNGVETDLVSFGYRSTGFSSWNRMSMNSLEKQMQRCLQDPTFALIYYDWRDDQDCTACTDDFLGASNDEGYLSEFSIFSSWRMICADFNYEATCCLMSDCPCERTTITRRPNDAPGIGKPNRQDVQYCMDQTTLDIPPYNESSTSGLRNCLEGYIDRYGRPVASMNLLWSEYCGGVMAQLQISTNDPMFPFHHTFLDKVYEIWIQRRNMYKNNYPNSPFYGHRYNDRMTPFFEYRENQDMLVPIIEFGIVYSSWNGM